MFRGVNAVKVDVKGRIVMPTRYRERLQDENAGHVVMTIETEERCLLLYPLSAWEVIEHKLTKLPSFNPVARRIQRLLIGHATELELDSQGRLRVPPLLREYAGLKKSAVLIGQGQKFELWDDVHWKQRRDAWLTEKSGIDCTYLPEEVKLLSL